MTVILIISKCFVNISLGMSSRMPAIYFSRNAKRPCGLSLYWSTQHVNNNKMLNRHIAIRVEWHSSLTFAALAARIRPSFLVSSYIFFWIIKKTLELIWRMITPTPYIQLSKSRRYFPIFGFTKLEPTILLHKVN